MWRGLADVAAKFLQKGKLVYIEGKLRTRSFEDKEGIKKYTTEVVAENFTLLGRKTDFESDIAVNRPTLKTGEPVNSPKNDQAESLPYE
jgi:single-strand DNA-binding protein